MRCDSFGVLDVYVKLERLKTVVQSIPMVPFTLLTLRLKFLAASGLALAPWLLAISQTQDASIQPVGSPRGKTAYEKGLEAWRKVGFVNNASCASCHGPDGLELAIYNFDDATIKRRALIHVNAEDAALIVDLIHADRDKYGIKTLRDQMTDRPFQPGGAVLPGDTPEARDAAFGEELQDKLPTLTHGRIGSIEDADKAKNELLSLDAWSLKVGFEFNRISEDIFHGKAHATIAQWLPDLPRSMTDDGRAAYYDLQDKYLADPSDANFFSMLKGVDKFTTPPSKMPAAAMSYDKFRATLILQHLERRALIDSAPLPHAPELFGSRPEQAFPNPMWDFGDLARRYSGLDLAELGFPKDVIVKKSGGPTAEAQLNEAKMPWLWLGWLSDQGLQRTGFDRQLQTAQYMSEAIWDEGPYPMHNIFFNAKKLLTQSFLPSAWSSNAPQHYVLDYSGFLRNGRHIQLEPKDPVAKQQYRTFVANCFRMNTYLLLDDLQKTHISWGKDSNKGHMRTFASYIDMVDPDSKAQTEALTTQVIDVIDDCAQRIR